MRLQYKYDNVYTVCKKPNKIAYCISGWKLKCSSRKTFHEFHIYTSEMLTQNIPTIRSPELEPFQNNNAARNQQIFVYLYFSILNSILFDSVNSQSHSPVNIPQICRFHLSVLFSISKNGKCNLCNHLCCAWMVVYTNFTEFYWLWSTNLIQSKCSCL